MHSLLERQLRQASAGQPGGDIDLPRLLQLVDLAYRESDRERRLVGRAHQMLAEELQALNARVNDAIAHLTLGFAIWDVNGRLVLCNNAMREMYPGGGEFFHPGADFAVILEQLCLRRLIDPEGKTPADWAASRLRRRSHPSGPVEVRLGNGAILEVREERTTEGGIVELATDVTGSRRRAAELVQAKEEADLANRAKSEFLTNMSHELRTPLNAIIGFSELMARGTLGPIGNRRYEEYVGDIQASAQHLLQIINDILDLAKIETGQARLNEEEFDTLAACLACYRLISGRAEQAGLRLGTDFPARLPRLRADQRMFKQVLINLLSNAVKFTPRGGSVVLGARLDPPAGLCFFVQDTGIGMDRIDIEKAFQAFRQIDSALNRRYEGTGLGLPITRALVEAHGGQVRIESAPGNGTRAMVTFPAERIVPD